MPRKSKTKPNFPVKGLEKQDHWKKLDDGTAKRDDFVLVPVVTTIQSSTSTEPIPFVEVSKKVLGAHKRIVPYKLAPMKIVLNEAGKFFKNLPVAHGSFGRLLELNEQSEDEDPFVTMRYIQRQRNYLTEWAKERPHRPRVKRFIEQMLQNESALRSRERFVRTEGIDLNARVQLETSQANDAPFETKEVSSMRRQAEALDKALPVWELLGAGTETYRAWHANKFESQLDLELVITAAQNPEGVSDHASKLKEMYDWGMEVYNVNIFCTGDKKLPDSHKIDNFFGAKFRKLEEIFKQRNEMKKEGQTNKTVLNNFLGTLRWTVANWKLLLNMDALSIGPKFAGKAAKEFHKTVSRADPYEPEDVIHLEEIVMGYHAKPKGWANALDGWFCFCILVVMHCCRRTAHLRELDTNAIEKIRNGIEVFPRKDKKGNPDKHVFKIDIDEQWISHPNWFDEGAKLNPSGGFRDFWLPGPLENFTKWDTKACGAGLISSWIKRIWTNLGYDKARVKAKTRFYGIRHTLATAALDSRNVDPDIVRRMGAWQHQLVADGYTAQTTAIQHGKNEAINKLRETFNRKGFNATSMAAIPNGSEIVDARIAGIENNEPVLVQQREPLNFKSPSRKKRKKKRGGHRVGAVVVPNQSQ